jgi:uncharacterized protein (DUF2342 family)
MEFSSSEEALLNAALSSHKFRLVHQLDLFRNGVDVVFKEAVEREIDAVDALKEKFAKRRAEQ